MDPRPASPLDGQLDCPMGPATTEQLDREGLDKISAYYSLAFPNVTYYPQTLTVTIGRRSVRQGAASSSESPQVDIDLGPLKSVSRYHARIEWEDNDDRFVLVVLGRNGAWVDGIWSGSGSRVPLGARSQIQIATRIFHFILPPPPAPEDSPSPSSPSTTRHATPSIDITSLSPPSSLPSPAAKPAVLPADPPPKEAAKPPPQKVQGKKRKKRDSDPEPPPAIMPPRPTFTYAQLCYRAIKSMEGKATLQEVCAWVAEQYEWYRYNKACGWESSVRHNLSGNRAFKKLERCAGERGKGFFWSVDPKFEHLFEGLDAKMNDSNGGKDGVKGKGKNQKANGSLLEPGTKRSTKGEGKIPLPPPLTSSPLPAFSTAPIASTSSAEPLGEKPPAVASAPPTETKDTSSVKMEVEMTTSSTSSPVVQTSPSSIRVDNAIQATIPTAPPDMIVPIVIGPPSTTPSTAPTSSTDASAFDTSYPPIALKGDTIILNPAIFSSLTPEQLKELEALGARKAIEILQSYIVRFLKEKIKAEGSKGKIKKKSKSKRTENGNGAAAKSSEAGARKSKAPPSTGPFTTAPLTMRKPPSSVDSATKRSALAQPGADTPDPDLTHPSRMGSPLVNGLQAAVAPLRISSPPPATALTDSADEIIDIMGDDSTNTEEPAAKRRKVDLVEPLTA